MPNTSTLGDARTANEVRRPAALELIGHSAAIQRVQELAKRAAAVDGGVLLVANRGCGVQAIARDVHELGRPPTAPFLVVDCTAGDAPHLARTLFGENADHTPSDLEWITADSRMAAARGGTLFLQDVTELSAAVQARLARVMRDGEVRLDGEPAPIGLRLMASAAPDIDADVHENRFRADLYRRLAASRIDVPPLGDRAEDVPAIALRLLEELCGPASTGASFTPTALALLAALTWRHLAELHGVIERVVAEALHDDSNQTCCRRCTWIACRRRCARGQPPRSPAPVRTRLYRRFCSIMDGGRRTPHASAFNVRTYRKTRQLGIPLAKVSD